MCQTLRNSICLSEGRVRPNPPNPPSLWTYIYILVWPDQRSRAHWKQDPALPENRVLNRCEASFNCMGVQINSTLFVLGQCRIYEAQLHATESIAMYEAARQEKNGLRTPRTTLNRSLGKFVGCAIQRTFEHTFVSTIASRIRLNYTQCFWNKTMRD